MKPSGYPKIWNLGHPAVDLLFEEDVVIEEKIDGSQFSFGILNGELSCRSKSKEIIVDAPEKMFEKAIESIKELEPLLHPDWIYRGEYVVKPKHNCLKYDRVPKMFVIIFDIEIGEQRFLSYEDKVKECERIGLECVPQFTTKVNSMDEFSTILESKSILGDVRIEGVVIKNYHRFGKDGKALMAKYVSEKFKERNKQNFKSSNEGFTDMIHRIGQELRTEARWQKAAQHLMERGELEHAPKDIGGIIKEIQKDTKEEMEEVIKNALFQKAWKTIGRAIVRGMPEWYKEELLKRQFE